MRRSLVVARALEPDVLLLHESTAPDEYATTFDHHVDAEPQRRFGLGPRGHLAPPLSREPADGAGDQMREAVLGGGGEPKQLGFVEATLVRDDPRDVERARDQCAGLVEDDRIDARQAL